MEYFKIIVKHLCLDYKSKPCARWSCRPEAQEMEYVRPPAGALAAIKRTRTRTRRGGGGGGEGGIIMFSKRYILYAVWHTETSVLFLRLLSQRCRCDPTSCCRVERRGRSECGEEMRTGAGQANGCVGLTDSQPLATICCAAPLRVAALLLCTLADFNCSLNLGL